VDVGAGVSAPDALNARPTPDREALMRCTGAWEIQKLGRGSVPRGGKAVAQGGCTAPVEATAAEVEKYENCSSIRPALERWLAKLRERQSCLP